MKNQCLFHSYKWKIRNGFWLEKCYLDTIESFTDLKRKIPPADSQFKKRQWPTGPNIDRELISTSSTTAIQNDSPKHGDIDQADLQLMTQSELEINGEPRHNL